MLWGGGLTLSPLFNLSMIEIKIYNEIGSCTFSIDGNKSKPFDASSVRDLFENNKSETDFRFNIHSNGGSVSEALTIYDIIRTSGKNIHCNIDGSCHSSAILLLLAAPLKNRTANPNATALIHDVSLSYAEGITPAMIDKMKQDLLFFRKKILDVYASRTGKNYTYLEKTMLEEKERDAKWLLQNGFISIINNYTNKKNNEMSKKEVQNRSLSVLEKIKNFFNANEPVNYQFFDSDQNLLFETESDNEMIEVGMSAAPDGSHNLTDGRIVVIEGGIITEIVEPSNSANNEIEVLKDLVQESADAIIEAEKEIANKDSIIKQKENEISNLKQEIENLKKSKTISNYKPMPRTTANKNTPSNTVASVDDVKAELVRNRNAKRIGGVNNGK